MCGEFMFGDQVAIRRMGTKKFAHYMCDDLMATHYVMGTIVFSLCAEDLVDVAANCRQFLSRHSA